MVFERMTFKARCFLNKTEDSAEEMRFTEIFKQV